MRLRVALAILVVLLVAAYTGATLSAEIGPENRIDAINLALIVLGVVGVALLIRPDIVNRLRLFELSGLRLEFEQVKEAQVKQGSRLDDISLVLPLLLPEPERRHLMNLATNKAARYAGNDAVRSELRRLRSIGLIRMRGGRHVGEIADGLLFDLNDHVELTELGERWVRRIREIEKAEVEARGSIEGL